MTQIRAIVSVTLRGLLGRRRFVLMLLLAALPVIVGLAIRLGGGRSDAAEILDSLAIRTVLPLVALVVGTAAIGSEVEDGTLVYLLTKPIARWRIAGSKLLVASVVGAVLVVPPVLVTGLLIGGLGDDGPAVAAGFAIATLVGCIAYASVFTALGALTTRALVIGLAYTLIWEGALAGLLAGTRFLSIRQATLGIAAALTGTDTGVDPLEPGISLAIIVVATVGAFLLATLALRRFEVRSAD
jgi:ABC-2 type transport system permease protein